MNLALLAVILTGITSPTPMKVCKDACGYRVGCLTPEAVTESVAEAMNPAPVCPPRPSKLAPAIPLQPDPNKTICIDGLLYFERTLTPKFSRYSSELYVERCE